MTPDPRSLSDEGLEAALSAARMIRRVNGSLGIRTEIARLEAEVQRRAEVRDLERAWRAS